MSVSRLALKLSVGIYSCLLVIYPVGFRREFGKQMVMVFEDMAKDAMRVGGVWGLVGVWYLVLSELWSTAREQHLLAGSYFRFLRIRNCVLQAFFSLMGLVGGLWWAMGGKH
ncbi:MAG: hypothetical protein KME29_01025 [Calothrix sp. FI2-JRJ7]|jgi:hypothetical protein|nr:hypothetical protein [Calothrix sp. FI2-JRJ7]